MKPYKTDSEVSIWNDAPNDGKKYVRFKGQWVESTTGTTNYNELSNKPAIGGTTLTKDSTAAGLGLETVADAEAMETRIAATIGARDFEQNHSYKQNQLIFYSNKLYRARYAFTSGTDFNAPDWQKVSSTEWGDIDGTITDQADLAAALNARLNKSADHANGSTVISNDDASSGFDIATVQDDTGTHFNFGTNTDAGNPVLGGMDARPAASTTTGTRRLLFVTDSGGNIRVHLRKDKPFPSAASDLSEDDLILNKGEIQAIVNDIMAALSQGLKTPGVIDKESNLPDASEADNGTYYVVQELDVTAPGQQGRAWKNDTLSPDAWQVVIDNVYAPDEEWINLTQSGALTLDADKQALINEALQSSQVEQTLPESDDQADETKLISRRAAFGLVPKQQDPDDEGKAMIIGSNGKLTPGVSGKVDSVNGIPPDENKNVKTDYIYQTEADFEAAKDNIPVGATVIKLYEYPKNLSPVPPIGFQYVQYARVESNDFDVAFPLGKRPESLWPGTSWSKLWEDEQVFFRTGGSLGSQLNRTDGKQDQASQLPSHTHSLSNHTHSVPSHTHGFGYNTPGAAGVGLDGGAVPIYAFSGVDDARTGTTNSGGSGTSGSGGSGTSGSASNSTETRPVNRLMVIWERDN
ncbi:MAG: hypothetical protein LBK62_12270 [Treponema sp.]|jgi:hypothetical protein|nr:hypothetical protein [Treponema sp.]